MNGWWIPPLTGGCSAVAYLLGGDAAALGFGGGVIFMAAVLWARLG